MTVPARPDCGRLEQRACQCWAAIPAGLAPQPTASGVVMDPVTVGAVLAAIAGGAGGAIGSQLWAWVGALVRRPLRHAHPARETAAVPSGSVELAALERAPGDQAAGLTLAQALVARAAADREFAQQLDAWWAQASQIAVTGDVTNTISGGTFSGPVMQGRDFTGLTFTTPAPTAPPSTADPSAG